MHCPVVTHPSEYLEMRAQSVTTITNEIVQLLEDIYETMLAHDGIGLAAPQTGENLQMTAIETNEGSGHLELINPVIIGKKGASTDAEGCLGIPETYGIIERAGEVTVRYFDREGEKMEVMACGYLAQVLQREVDHLNSELFVDKMIEKTAPEDLEAYMKEHFDD